jgi:hypothetical protein
LKTNKKMVKHFFKSWGRGFESLRAHQANQILRSNLQNKRNARVGTVLAKQLPYLGASRRSGLTSREPEPAIFRGASPLDRGRC